jgi:endonuclease YncB( thermonuclease family)
MIRAVLFLLLAAACLIGVFVAIERSEPRNLAAPATDPVKPPPGPPVANAPLAGVQSVAAAAAHIRDVTPGNFTAGPPVSGPLKRVAVPAVAAEPPAPRARVERLRNPIVTSAGVLYAEKRKIRLAGIVAPEFEARCGEAAATWPCGRMARAALRQHVHGRAIDCELSPGADAIPDPADCRVGSESLAAWLVAQGWAAGDGPRYAALDAKARTAKLGIWSADRPGGEDLDFADQPGAVAESSPDSALEIKERVSGTP